MGKLLISFFRWTQVNWLFFLCTALNFNTGIYLCICHPSQDPEQFHHPKGLPRLSLCSHTRLPQALTKPWPTLRHSSFVFPRMPWKRNHTTGNVLRLASFTWLNHFAIPPRGVCVSVVHCFSLPRTIQLWGEPVCTFITEGHGIVSSWGNYE